MEKNPTKKIVSLRVYQGVKLSFNEDGSVQNTNHVINTEYNTNEWRALMSTLSYSGYAKVDVVAVKEEKDGGYVALENIKEIEKEVSNSFSPLVEVEETPEQKRIAELEAKLEALINKSEPKKEDLVETDKSIEDIRVEYEEVVGKKPHHMAKAETLLKEIEDNK